MGLAAADLFISRQICSCECFSHSHKFFTHSYECLTLLSAARMNPSFARMSTPFTRMSQTQKKEAASPKNFPDHFYLLRTAGTLIYTSIFLKDGYRTKDHTRINMKSTDFIDYNKMITSFKQRIMSYWQWEIEHDLPSHRNCTWAPGNQKTSSFIAKLLIIGLF